MSPLAFTITVAVCCRAPVHHRLEGTATGSSTEREVWIYYLRQKWGGGTDSTSSESHFEPFQAVSTFFGRQRRGSSIFVGAELFQQLRIFTDQWSRHGRPLILWSAWCVFFVFLFFFFTLSSEACAKNLNFEIKGLISSVSSSSKGGSNDINLIENLVTSYIKKPSCIILLTVACESELPHFFRWYSAYIFSISRLREPRSSPPDETVWPGREAYNYYVHY